MSNWNNPQKTNQPAPEVFLLIDNLLHFLLIDDAGHKLQLQDINGGILWNNPDKS